MAIRVLEEMVKREFGQGWEKKIWLGGWSGWTRKKTTDPVAWGVQDEDENGAEGPGRMETAEVVKAILVEKR